MRAQRSWAERFVLGAPGLWLVLFFLVPFLIVLKISFSQAALSQPPYEPVLSLTADWTSLLEKLSALTAASYETVLGDSLYLDAYLSSLRLAVCATLLTLLIGYPLAYAIARAPEHSRPALLMLAIAPFWTSFLIRVYAWIAILKDEGLLNLALMKLGLISKPLQIFATDWAVLIGITYSYLPFMILPLYNAIERQPRELREAAADLGAKPESIFWRVTVPLSRGGIIAGCLLVFIPAIGEFVIPDLLGGSDTLMIGKTLWVEFFDNRDWPVASAVAVVLLLLLLLPMALYERSQMKGEAR
jgi:putrescine transport system permease protein